MAKVTTLVKVTETDPTIPAPPELAPKLGKTKHLSKRALRIRTALFFSLGWEMSRSKDIGTVET